MMRIDPGNQEEYDVQSRAFADLVVLAGVRPGSDGARWHPQHVSQVSVGSRSRVSIEGRWGPGEFRRCAELHRACRPVSTRVRHMAGRFLPQSAARTRNDEPHARRAKVGDVQTEQRHLPPKLHAKLPTLQRRPKPQLRRRRALLAGAFGGSKLGPMPTQEARRKRRHRSARPPAGVET
jgi:hypothetical protein